MEDSFITVFQQELPLSETDHDHLLAADRRGYATLLLSPCLGELKQHRQAELLRTVYHLEREEGQTGAVFLSRR